MAQCGHDQCTWVGQVRDKDDHERRQCHRATGAGVSDHRHNQPNTVWPCVDLKKCLDSEEEACCQNPDCRPGGEDSGLQPTNAAARRAAKRRRQHEARLKRVAAEEAARRAASVDTASQSSEVAPGLGSQGGNQVQVEGIRTYSDPDLGNLVSVCCGYVHGPLYTTRYIFLVCDMGRVRPRRIPGGTRAIWERGAHHLPLRHEAVGVQVLDSLVAAAVPVLVADVFIRNHFLPGLSPAVDFHPLALHVLHILALAGSATRQELGAAEGHQRGALHGLRCGDVVGLPSQELFRAPVALPCHDLRPDVRNPIISPRPSHTMEVSLRIQGSVVAFSKGKPALHPRLSRRLIKRGRRNCARSAEIYYFKSGGI